MKFHHNKYRHYFNYVSDFLSKYPREYFVFGFFSVVLSIVIFKLFSFTVLNHEYYSTLASKQQTMATKSRLSRGNIYSTNEKANVLSTSVDLDDLAVDPSVEGDKNKLNSFLTDIVYTEICYLKKATECKKSLSKFLGVLDIVDFQMSEKYLKPKIAAKVAEKTSRTKVTSVLLRDNLSQEQAFALEKMLLKGVYVNGMNVYVNPEEITDQDFVANKLAEVLSDKVEDIKHAMRKRDLRYVSILNKLSISTSETIESKLAEENQAYNRGFVGKDKIISPFIILTPSQHRLYPENDMASTILGFVDNDGEGKYGIEGYYNHILKGKQAQTFSKKDITGKSIDPISFTQEAPSVAGANITLTIDRNIQKKVEEIIDEDIQVYKANKISAIVMDPKTGAILAMANNPRFDPNSPSDAFELEKVSYFKYPNPAIDLLGYRVFTPDNINGKEYYYDNKKILLREMEREELGNMKLEKYIFVNKEGPGSYKNDIIQDLYEPGSIMKTITMAAGLDSGEINRYDIYRDEGSVQIDNFKISNVAQACMGYKTYQNAMNYSCNVGMINIAQKLGSSLLYKYLDAFGIGKPTGITLEGEVNSKLTPYEKWSRAQLFTTSFGKGITANMLQMAEVYSIIANGGVYVKPQIVKSVEFADGKTMTYKPEVTHRVIKESTSKTMIQVLVDGVKNGVAKGGAVKGYTIAGKTGTSQMVYKGKYESGTASTNGSFAGFGPAEDPKFVIIVRVDRPRSSIFGGETVSKSFAKIAQYLFEYYKIPPKQ